MRWRTCGAAFARPVAAKTIPAGARYNASLRPTCPSRRCGPASPWCAAVATEMLVILALEGARCDFSCLPLRFVWRRATSLGCLPRIAVDQALCASNRKVDADVDTIILRLLLTHKENARGQHKPHDLRNRIAPLPSINSLLSFAIRYASPQMKNREVC